MNIYLFNIASKKLKKKFADVLPVYDWITTSPHDSSGQPSGRAAFTDSSRFMTPDSPATMHELNARGFD